MSHLRGQRYCAEPAELTWTTGVTTPRHLLWYRCMSGTLVSLSGARKLLRHSLPLVGPIDVHLNAYNKQDSHGFPHRGDKLRFYQSRPQLMAQTNEVCMLVRAGGMGCN